MKSAFENILKAIAVLPEHTQKYVVSQLKFITKEINILVDKNEKQYKRLNGVEKSNYNDILEKAIEILTIFGFNEFSFIGLNPEFIAWFKENTINNSKYNPKLMNWYLLTSMEQAYYLTKINEGEHSPSFSDVKKTLKDFESKEYEKYSQRTLTELINEMDGKV